jgi:hypothetical protein
LVILHHSNRPPANSAENLFVVFFVSIAPSSQELGPPANPGRFILPVAIDHGKDKLQWLPLSAQETCLQV